MIVVHGFGCDQHMRRDVRPAFLNAFTVIRYDLTGSGRSDLSAQVRNTQHSTPDATIAAKRKVLTAAQRMLATQ